MFHKLSALPKGLEALRSNRPQMHNAHLWLKDRRNFFDLNQSHLEPLVKPVEVAPDVDRDGMMQDPIEDGSVDHPIAEHLALATETLIAGQKDRAVFVAAADELKEEFHSHPVEGR